LGCGLGWAQGTMYHVRAWIPKPGAILGVVPPIECIRLCKQQTSKKHRAADLSARAACHSKSFRMDSPAMGVAGVGPVWPFVKIL